MNHEKNTNVLMLERHMFPGEISKLFFNKYDDRISNDTAIIIDKSWMEPEEGNFDEWLTNTYDLSEVEAIIVDVTW
jgi:hypothetical protein